MTAPSAWAGRTAIVTGASRGIGRAVAIELAARGCRLALVARDADRLAQVAAACREAAPDGASDPLVVAADVTDATATRSWLPDVLSGHGGRLDLLANVAGASLRHAGLEDLGDADWEASFALHVYAPARLQRACFGALAAAGGCVANVGSVVAEVAPTQGAPYAAAKAALASLTRSTAVEWARHGVRAVTVEPGYVATAFNDELVQAGLEDRLLARVPTRRPIDPAAVARLLVAVASPEHPDLTGATVRLDGGMRARL